jgi:hypothetical protein
MGRMIKNAVPRTASYAIGLPIGTSSIGPDPVTLGQTRWNTSTSKFEYYNGTMWYAVAHEGAATVVKDSLGPGDNTNSVFGPMSYSYNPGQEAQVIAVVNNVIQEPGVGFTFMGNTSIKFTSVPTTSAPIYVLHNYASTSAA